MSFIQRITWWQGLLHCLDLFSRIYGISWHQNHGVCSILWVSSFIITFFNLQSWDAIISNYNVLPSLSPNEPSSRSLPSCSLSVSWPLFAIVVSAVAACRDDGDSGSCCGVCACMIYAVYYTHTNIYALAHTYTCVYALVCMCMCVHVHVCVCIPKHINTSCTVWIMSWPFANV